jgi:hypothetical protein
LFDVVVFVFGRTGKSLNSIHTVVVDDDEDGCSQSRVWSSPNLSHPPSLSLSIPIFPFFLLSMIHGAWNTDTKKGKPFLLPLFLRRFGG